MNEFFRESFLESNMTQKIPQKIKDIEIYKAQQDKYGKFECIHELGYVENKKEKNNNNNIINENNINNEKTEENKIMIILLLLITLIIIIKKKKFLKLKNIL